MSATTQAEIRKPVEKELREFEKHFRESMRSKVALLDRITYYIVKRKGKQVRPTFVFLCAALCGQIGEKTYTAASLIELLHTATLVHDDVVDDAWQRRSFFSINALWKNKVAVLVGDYLLSRGLLLALDNEAYELLQLASRAVREMAEGELLQMEKARRLDIEESVYYDIIRKKTASLIASACACGAASTTDDPRLIRQMHDFGEHIGMAFQVRDDLFDYGNADVGKPTGIDIKEQKMTLPLIYALQHTNKKKRKYIINLIKRHNENKQKVAEVIAFVNESGGIAYTQAKMQEFKQKAFDILNTFPDCPSRDSLSRLVDFVTDRKK